MPATEGRSRAVGQESWEAASSNRASSGFLGRQGNATFMLRAVSWLVGEAEATIVSVQDRENRRIDLTERQRVWMYLVNVGLLPLIPLVAGVIVFIRSRR